MRVRLVALALLLAGCGAEQPASSVTERTESPALPSAPSPSPSPSPMATPPVATAPSAPAPPPDAGVEEGHGAQEVARTPVRVVVDAEGVTPPRVTVPAFLAVRVTVRNQLPRAAVTVRLGNGRVRVRARGRRSFDVGGLQRGEHALDAGRAGRATVVAE